MDDRFGGSNTGKADDHHWLINPKHLKLAITPVIPPAACNLIA